MYFRSLRLINFRNFQDTEISFNNLTIFLGSNGAGKTNLLEAIYFLSFGASPKEITSQEVIKKGENFARLFGQLNNYGSTKKTYLELVLEKKDQKIFKITKINGVKKPNKDFFSKFSCVLFSPEDLNLIYSSPSLRRRYFNMVSSHLAPNFKVDFLKFQKTLLARNRLLLAITEGKASADELDFWNQKFAKYGSLIISERKKVVDFFNKWLSLAYSTISGQKKSLGIEYQTQIKGDDIFEIERNFQKELLENQEKETKFGFSIIGPQRDDFIFALGNNLVFNFASRGEARTVVLALKFIELKLLEERGFKPILLLDDVFSELDEARRDFLSNLFKRQQTIVTTTDLEHIKENIRRKAKILKIENNQIKEV